MTPPLTALKYEPPFACTRCGACCRSVSFSPLTAWLDKGDGICQHLDEQTELCAIYESRPDVCRIDLQYEVHYVRHLSWKEFSDLNLQCCEALQKRISDTSTP